MKYVILGGVAAGTKAAAKLKRLDRQAKVQIFTKGADISYAGCGLPYYIGGDIASREELIVNSPEKYAGLTGAQVQTGCEAVGVESGRKAVSIRRTDGSVFEETYDRLIIATGALRSPGGRCGTCGNVLRANAGRCGGDPRVCQGQQVPQGGGLRCRFHRT